MKAQQPTKNYDRLCIDRADCITHLHAQPIPALHRVYTPTRRRNWNQRSWARRLRSVTIMVLGTILGLLAVFSARAYVITEKAQLQHLVTQVATEYEVPPAVALAIADVESSWRPWVRSSADAIGLMQVKRTAAQDVLRLTKRADYDVGDLYDPERNVRFGVSYLSLLANHYFADAPVRLRWALAVAAYHEGPTSLRGRIDLASIETIADVEAAVRQERATAIYVNKVAAAHDYFSS